jgi:hypothetical protein
MARAARRLAPGGPKEATMSASRALDELGKERLVGEQVGHREILHFDNPPGSNKLRRKSGRLKKMILTSRQGV